MLANDTWLLRGGLVLPSADHPVTKTDIVIHGDSIAEVGSNIDPERHKITRVVDVDDKLVVPGFVNSHYHSHDRWDRGRFSPLPLEIWMSLYNPPTYGRGWTPDEIYLRTLIGAIELVRGGTTSVLDDVHMGLQIDDDSIDAVMRAYQDIGLRADVGIAYSDIPGHETIPYLDELLPQKYKTEGQTAARSRDEMLHCWLALSEKWSERVRSVVSLSGPQRCTVEFQQRAADLASEMGRPVLTHVLETRIQAMSAYHYYGCSMIDHMDKIGILRDNTVVIHGVWMTPGDLDKVATAGAGVSHNPVSNTKLGSGIAPVRSMLKRNIPVGLGTDNHNANDNCSMFESLKLAALLQPLTTADYRQWLDADDSLRMATEYGARLIGYGNRVGRLEPTYKADFLVFDLDADSFFPLNNAAVHLTFANCAAALTDVFVGGDAVLRDRSIVTVAEADIRNEIKARTATIQKKVLGGVPDSTEMEKFLVAAFDKCMADSRMAAYKDRFNCCDES